MDDLASAKAPDGYVSKVTNLVVDGASKLSNGWPLLVEREHFLSGNFNVFFISWMIKGN